MIEFAWPWMFLLAPLPLMLSLLLPPPAADADAIHIPGRLAEAMSEIADGKQEGTFSWRKVAFWIAWLCLIAALARPSWRGDEEIRFATGRALILAIDLSGSMERRDLVMDGQSVDRLTAVKLVAGDFARNRQGDRLGLVLYGDEAFVASPLTFDVAAVSNAIAEAAIGMAGRTTAIGDALGLAIVKLRDDPGRSKAIILLSDGTNNAGSAEPEDAASLAREFGIRIHTIGLGSASTGQQTDAIDPSADLDIETLRAVAEASGGRHFRAASLDDLQSVYDEISSIEAESAPTPPVAQRRDLVLLPAAVVFLILGLLGFPAMGRLRT